MADAKTPVAAGLIDFEGREALARGSCGSGLSGRSQLVTTSSKLKFLPHQSAAIQRKRRRLLQDLPDK
jgi:hypothetical protein